MTIHENLGVLLELMGKPEAAEAEYRRETLPVAERAFGAEHQTVRDAGNNWCCFCCVKINQRQRSRL